MCGTIKFDIHECGKEFSSKELLNKHKKIHAGDYRCKECGNIYCSQQALARHAVIHSGEYFTCNICAKIFSAKFNLMKHMKSIHN